jgi:predicted AlkP superfamily pyrophosphatase or phosphodiesterase
VREAWTRAEIEQRDSDLAQLYRNSFDPEKSGDLTIQFEPSCLPDFDGSGTSHGSPYAYDRNVPIVFWGAGIEARRVSGRAVTVDIAPSLAARLGIAPPSDLDGRNLLN